MTEHEGEAVDPRPDPATWSAGRLVGRSDEEKLAALRALEARAEEEATARRGRPLQPGDVSRTKGSFPVVTHVVRPAPSRDADQAEGERRR